MCVRLLYRNVTSATSHIYTSTAVPGVTSQYAQHILAYKKRVQVCTTYSVTIRGYMQGGEGVEEEEKYRRMEDRRRGCWVVWLVNSYK